MSVVLDVVEVNGQVQAILPEARIMGVSKSDVTKAPLPSEETEGYTYAPWGEDDCLPTQIREKIYQVPMAGQAIYKLIAMLYGNGLAYYKNADILAAQDKDPENWTRNIRRAYVPGVETWMRRNRISTKWLIPQFADYRFYMNAFSEFILSRKRDQITGIYHKPAEFCRLGVMNERSLKIEQLHYNPEFATGEATERYTKKIPLFDWIEEEYFLSKLRGYKFAYHSRFETPGITYYARPFWLGLFRKDGWLDASIAVPEIVNAMMKNQVRLKYQILIPESYFEIRHRDWNSYTDNKRNKIIDALIKMINETLSGTKNAYQSISTVFKQDNFGKEMGKIEILAIDDKVKKDSWVPSSEKADAQIVQGLGLHPSLLGLAPEGGKMGAGSGSDKRESFNTGITLNTIEQEIILEPLQFVADFNSRKNPEWDITFFIDHTYHTTTNNQEDGLQKSETSLDVKS